MQQLSAKLGGVGTVVYNVARYATDISQVSLGLLYTGNAPAVTLLLIAGWGLLYAPGVLVATFSIGSAAPEALEFANGLTASFANFSVTLGTVAGGWVISQAGIAHTPWLSLGLGVAAIGLVGARSLWDQRHPSLR